ncbi:MAG: 23S rRNA (adenine(2030)-N(6))-methyltransferase RlmJ [Gammaproteobacteria bacterium]
MSYQHDQHVGNHADVFKHFTWFLLLRGLINEGRRLRVMESHAGAGRYAIDPDGAEGTSGLEPSWASGLARLLSTEVGDGALGRFVQLLRHNAVAQPSFYAGSPLLSAGLCHRDDRLILVERDDATRDRLAGALHDDPRVRFLGGDGFEAVASPPKDDTRRTLLLVDPPYVETGEVEQVETLCGRWSEDSAPGAVIVVWYPLMDTRPVPAFPPGNRAELRVRRSGGLYGSGVWWRGDVPGLSAELGTALPALAPALAQDEFAGARLWDTP